MQPPIMTTPITTHVEGMSVGSRMMTQLVSDLTEQCGTKAVDLFKVIMAGRCRL